MRRIHISILLLAFCIMASAQTPKHEVRAVWLTTIGGLDWPHRYSYNGNGTEIQKQELCNILDKYKDAGINTILLQTRIRETVIYPSQYESWDGCLSGKPGISPGYDALQFAIDECHKRGIHVMLDIPGCAGIDLYHERPDLMSKNEDGTPKIPQGWQDIRMMEAWKDKDKKILNPA